MKPDSQCPKCVSKRPDLCPMAVLQRVWQFMADEVKREVRRNFRPNEYLAGMHDLKSLVEDLIYDITHDPKENTDGTNGSTETSTEDSPKD